MRLHRDDGSEQPCKHMEGLLNQVADGTAGRATRWYVLAHVLHCDRCRRFLEALKGMITQLRLARSKEPSPSAVDRILSHYRAEMSRRRNE